MENGNISQGEGKDPSSFLSDIIGNPVTVKLNSGVVYKGESAPLPPKPQPANWPRADAPRVLRGRRRAPVRRWLHEHRPGEDGGVRQRRQAEGVW